MPRILPRLAKLVEKDTIQQKNFPFLPKSGKRTKSLFKPALPAPSFHPSHYDQSVLLAPQSPVTNKKDYVQHKRVPPSLSGPGKIVDPKQPDPPRQMTKQEFAWWSNPYLRMLASPIRTCISTGKSLPTDLLVRFTGLNLPPSKIASSNKKQSSPAIISPDGILHPKYASRKFGGGFYVLCWRKAVENLQKGAYKRVSAQLSYPPHLPDYVAHLLRLCVLQEFELLAQRLEYAVKHSKSLGLHGTILRRLTNEEWDTLKSTGVIPYPSAVAVLDIPPVDVDPITNERPQPSMSALPPEDEDRPADAPPISVLMPTSTGFLKDPDDILPHAQVPLYNSKAAFPSRSQRAALHAILTRILTAEDTVRRLHIKWGKVQPFPTECNSPASTPSRTLLLCSDSSTAKRGDPAAIARALWRLGMYESDGWSFS